MTDDSPGLRSGRVLGEDGGPDKARPNNFVPPGAQNREQNQWSI